MQDKVKEKNMVGSAVDYSRFDYKYQYIEVLNEGLLMRVHLHSYHSDTRIRGQVEAVPGCSGETCFIKAGYPLHKPAGISLCSLVSYD
jgi:hypothetical protein